MKVLETRSIDDHSKSRRYECYNYHRFTTIETIKKGAYHSPQNFLATALKEPAQYKGKK